MLKRIAPIAAIFSLAIAAHGQAWISEVLINAPNGGDDNREFVEIQSSSNFNFNGWYFLVIDGDGSTNSGTVDQAIDLSGYVAGSNGLLLVSGANVVLYPTPDPATSIYYPFLPPAIENGSNTFLLGYGTPPAFAADLDSNDDGTLDAGALNGFTVVDAVAFMENDGPLNFEYADDAGFASANLGSNPGFNADELYRVRATSAVAPAGWAGGDVLGSDPGPFNFDSARNFGFATFGYPNAAVIPCSPGTLNVVTNATTRTISGTVTLDSFIGDRTVPEFQIQVVDSGNVVLETVNLHLTSAGGYSFTTGVGAGTYSLKCKGGTWLRRTLSRTFDASSNVIVDFNLQNGDVDGDNEVGIADYAILSANYNQFTVAGDLDGDEEVGIGDYAILSFNYGSFGDD